MINVLSANLCSISAMSASGRMDIDIMLDTVMDKRKALIAASFPYIDMSEKAPRDLSDEEYDRLFDELDEYNSNKISNDVSDKWPEKVSDAGA